MTGTWKRAYGAETCNQRRTSVHLPPSRNTVEDALKKKKVKDEEAAQRRKKKPTAPAEYSPPGKAKRVPVTDTIDVLSGLMNSTRF